MERSDIKPSSCEIRMRCTLYILRCLHTGNHSMGVTTNLQARMNTLLNGHGRNRIRQPEIMHIEHFEDIMTGHRRLQQIRSRWNESAPLGALDSADRPLPGGN